MRFIFFILNILLEVQLLIFKQISIDSDMSRRGAAQLTEDFYPSYTRLIDTRAYSFYIFQQKLIYKQDYHQKRTLLAIKKPICMCCFTSSLI